MPFVHFIYFENDDSRVRMPAQDTDRVRSIVCGIPAVTRALLFLPAQARDFYTDDGASPRLALQLYYDTLEDLEAAIAVHGAAQQLTAPDIWQSLGPLTITHQAMYARRYPVLDETYRPDGDESPCSYLVHYPGQADNLPLWLDYYLDHHPQIMKFFPRIREIEIYTRVDWRDSLPWTRVEYIQRNRLIFDSAAALEAALNSPVRHEMRADFEKFPPFTGSNIHYPMFTESLPVGSNAP